MSRTCQTRNTVNILRRPSRPAARLFPLAALLFLVLGSAAHAQLSGKGAVSGTILDPTGAAIPGATIVITDDANGVATTTTSTSAGDYSISTLDPGTYTITVSAKGFEKLTQKSVEVNALETLTLNPKLTIGAADQSVTVSTLPPQLETTNAMLGATMDNEMYSALPISMGSYGSPDQRRATDFALLMPGAQGNETNGNATDNTGPIDGSGSRGAAAAIYIDGLPFTNVAGEGDNRYVWTSISVDAVNQFQVETAGYPALYEGQGVMNFTVKQGGSKYHGAVYEFFRNTALDTWGFFQVKSNLTNLPIKPVEHQNEYGIVLSGPLVPFGAWKNKVFAFANYDGYRYSKIIPTYVTFPSAAEQAGNFQGIEPIYDPNTQTACTANSTTGQCRYRFGYVAGTGTGPAGNPVIGPGGAAAVDVIPSSEMSAVALKMQSYIPALINQPSPATNTAASLANNYVSPNPNGLINWSTTERIDYIISPKNTLTIVGAAGRQGSSAPVGQTTAGRNVAAAPYNYGQAYAPKTVVAFIEDTHTFTEHLVNQFKYGFARYDSYDYNTEQTPAYAATTMGITGLPSGQAAGSFPEVTFAGIDPVEQWAGYTGSVNIGNSYILIDNVQWVHKNHSITIGGEIGWMQYNQVNDPGGSSQVILATAVTETAGFTNATTLAPSTGDSYASFLVGQIDKASLTQNVVQETGARFRPISPYIQDNWKVNSKLTVDVGLRYDYYPPYHEAHDVLSFFNPTLTNPVTNAPGAIQYAGSGANTCNCSTPVKRYYKNWGPRLGIAYQSDARTVWRASYGVMYTHGNGVGGSAISRTGTGDLGFSAAPAFSSSTATFLSTAPLPAFPAYTPAQGVASGNAYGTGYTTTTGYTSTPTALGYGDSYYGGRAPQYINWTIGFQHQWTNSFTSNINYVGSQGHFLITDGGNPRGYWADQLDPKYLYLGSCLGAAITKLATTTNSLNGQNCATELTSAGIAIPSWFSTSQSLSTALTPFPQYKVSDSYSDVANANYNALQMTLTQRPARGVTFMLNYTWSRAIDDGGTFRTGYAIPAGTIAGEPNASWSADRIERSVSTSNQPHHLVFTGVEDLPFGKGMLGGGRAWSRAVLGGFKFSQIMQLYSGSPLALTASSGQTNPAVSTVEPTVNPNFIGPVRINGKWGKGSTSSSLLSYIAPSAGTATAPTGPFIAPSVIATSPFAPPYTFGNASRTSPYGLTSQGNFDLDISLRRTFNLHLTDTSKFSLQADMYNVTNYVLFAAPSVSLGSSTFGQPGGSQANNSRDVQLSARLEF